MSEPAGKDPKHKGKVIAGFEQQMSTNPKAPNPKPFLQTPLLVGIRIAQSLNPKPQLLGLESQVPRKSSKMCCKQRLLPDLSEGRM